MKNYCKKCVRWSCVYLFQYQTDMNDLKRIFLGKLSQKNSKEFYMVHLNIQTLRPMAMLC